MKTEELVAALRKCGSVGAGCDGCPFENGGAIDAEWCGDALVRAAADRLEGYVDRCKRYADEIMELRERGREVRPMPSTKDVLRALRRLKVETGSLACFGCGREHNCGIRGCAILRDAIALIEELTENRSSVMMPKEGGSHE